MKFKKIESNFSQLPNQPMYDKDMSFAAKGLLAYVHSKPDDYQFSSKRIAEETKDGIDKIKKLLIELETCGYLTRNKLPTGRVEYELHFKKDKPETVEATEGISLKGKEHPLNNTDNIITLSNNNSPANAGETNEETKKVSGGDINAVISYFYKAMAPAALNNAIKNRTIRGAAEGLLENYSITEIRTTIDKNKVKKEGFGKCYSLSQFVERFEAIKSEGVSKPVYINLDN